MYLIITDTYYIYIYISLLFGCSRAFSCSKKHWPQKRTRPNFNQDAYAEAGFWKQSGWNLKNGFKKGDTSPKFKITIPKRKGSSSNHPFLGAMFVSFKEGSSLDLVCLAATFKDHNESFPSTLRLWDLTCHSRQLWPWPMAINTHTHTHTTHDPWNLESNDPFQWLEDLHWWVIIVFYSNMRYIWYI